MPTKKQKEKVFPLYYDLQAKNLFGTNKNKKFTQDLLEKYFGYEEGKLRGCKITNSVRITSEILSGKTIEMDIRVKLPDRNMVNLEFYSVYDEASEIKSFFYITKLFGNQLKRGEEYERIKKVRQLNFIYEDKIRDNDKGIKKFAVINRDDPFDYIMKNSFEIDIINLAIRDKKAYNEVNDGLVDWILFMGAQNYEEMEKYSRGKPILEEALEEMTRFSNDKETSGFFTRDAFDKMRLKIETEKSKEEGVKEGVEETKIEIAKKMLECKEDVSKIHEYTGLSIEEINELIEN